VRLYYSNLQYFLFSSLTQLVGDYKNKQKRRIQINECGVIIN